jgi:hypothetical protein
MGMHGNGSRQAVPQAGVGILPHEVRTGECLRELGTVFEYVRKAPVHGFDDS